MVKVFSFSYLVPRPLWRGIFMAYRWYLPMIWCWYRRSLLADGVGIGGYGWQHWKGVGGFGVVEVVTMIR